MKKERVMLIIGVAALAGAAIYWYRKRDMKKKLDIVADAGYETAYDVHFPIKYKGRRKMSL